MPIRVAGFQAVTGHASPDFLPQAGTRLLDGAAEWIELNGGIDKWLGGVHLAGEPKWGWEESGKTLVER